MLLFLKWRKTQSFSGDGADAKKNPGADGLEQLGS